MTCKDCLYYEACNGWQMKLYNLPIEQSRNADKCRFSKNKANFVEVVKCKNCQHFISDIITEGVGWCEKIERGFYKENFCSYGQKKEG